MRVLESLVNLVFTGRKPEIKLCLCIAGPLSSFLPLSPFIEQATDKYLPNGNPFGDNNQP
jgi:hypothetical protein